MWIELNWAESSRVERVLLCVVWWGAGEHGTGTMQWHANADKTIHFDGYEKWIKWNFLGKPNTMNIFQYLFSREIANKFQIQFEILFAFWNVWEGLFH